MKKILKIVCIIIVLAACSKDDDLKTVDETNNKHENQKATGSSSHDLLSDNTFKSLVIELVYVEGLKPSQNTIDNFVSFLNARTFKPNGITVETRAIASTGKTSYTNQDIIAIEDAHRTKYNINNQIAVWALFIDGASENTTNSGAVLGTAYRNTSFVIFEETIQELSNSTFEPNRSVLETTVVTHEFGHLLGLTNLGSNMVENHEDPEHVKHCNVESCLMYWAAENGSGLSNLVGASTAPQLDAKCIADLQANGGK
ncbi:zinc metalloprotease [Confluentibacter flavum]|uniref:Membrane metalloprotease n=1 Tax=Confluentibacter flavum TaxID=1909700 RepID=A0A2N3HJE4_9FLAO|nr:membrane metalloprotease [Confluentibacter flavum]PKQ45077.1 membrane metalloprotease [Confluentibacter flavum]